MASVIDICNVALGKLGGKRISSIDNPSTDTEELCALFYPIVLKKMLEERNWTFLVRREILSTPLAENPAWGYNYGFQTPPNAVRIIDVRGNTYENTESGFEWRKEGDEIVCNSDRIYITYLTSDVSSLDLSGLFILGFATYLASQMCIQITENRSLKNDLLAEADMLISDAATNDGMQGASEMKYSGALVEARQGMGVAYEGSN